MALVSSVLNIEVSKIMDNEHLLFEGFPQNNIEVADRWSKAINTYACKVLPASNTFKEAEQSMKSVLLGIGTGNGDVILKLAFTSYAITLALGMQASGFTATPPPTQIDFTALFALSFSGAKQSEIVNLFVTITDVWFI